MKFDPGRIAVEGDAVPLVENVSYSRASDTRKWMLPETGMLVYRRGAESGPFVAAQRDRSGWVAPLVTTSGRYSWPRASTDGRLPLIATDRGTTAIRVTTPGLASTASFPLPPARLQVVSHLALGQTAQRATDAIELRELVRQHGGGHVIRCLRAEVVSKM